MKVKYFVLAGAIGMLTIVGMPQTEASALDEVMGAETRMVSMSYHGESISSSVARHVKHEVDKEIYKTKRRIKDSVDKKVDGIFRGLFH